MAAEVGIDPISASPIALASHLTRGDALAQRASQPVVDITSWVWNVEPLTIHAFTHSRIQN
ncbi:hypothetical protein LC613_23055 [Nostoc sphaeroides CHAB 2801]|uniref:hypothetical protein n=1 Tax=Nostoc sphaeroides TaxID=446679 RepID=UPI001C70023A|nr:hypothetical protein [Nostoc sphaeroides]MCC5630717.1 hypothetical protein [Nostoc sphaeroides CHAB 2801]